jgi:hypothetical protein
MHAGGGVVFSAFLYIPFQSFQELHSSLLYQPVCSRHRTYRLVGIRASYVAPGRTERVYIEKLKIPRRHWTALVFSAFLYIPFQSFQELHSSLLYQPVCSRHRTFKGPRRRIDTDRSSTYIDVTVLSQVQLQAAAHKVRASPST